MINKTQLLVTRGDTAEPMKSRAVDQAFVFFEEISLQMDGKHDNAAKTGNAPPEGKQSYIQAASKTQHQPFYRKIDYNLAVVQHIHRTKNNAYARISMGEAKNGRSR